MTIISQIDVHAPVPPDHGRGAECISGFEAGVMPTAKNYIYHSPVAASAVELPLKQ